MLLDPCPVLPAPTQPESFLAPTQPESSLAPTQPESSLASTKPEPPFTVRLSSFSQQSTKPACVTTGSRIVNLRTI